jgi:predicted nucleic acid-binding protein
VTRVVLDASLALSLVLPDENSGIMERILRESSQGAFELVTAPHWLLELQNGLLQAARRKRIAAADRLPALELLAGLPVAVAGDQAPATVLFSVADKETLSIYDAAYLALALQQRARLATGDGGLARAAERNGVLWK